MLRNPQTSGVWGSHPQYATHAGIRTSVHSSRPHGRPSSLRRNAPLPIQSHNRTVSRGFGALLSPVTLSAPVHSTSELLRTLSRMAASKPTSWLSEHTDHLSHSSRDLGALAGGLGCFPLDDESSHPPSHFQGSLLAFMVWLGSVSALPPHPSSSLPPAPLTL